MARLTPVIGSDANQRVVFCGPLGVGKTTAVRSISDVEVANTDVVRAAARHGAPTPGAKTTTTVGIDYGEWRRADGSTVAVYGTPGQVRFDAVRKSAIGSRLTLVLWLFGQNEYALDEADEWLTYLAGVDPTVLDLLTVAITRLDASGPHPGLRDFRELLDTRSSSIPLTVADPRNRGDVEHVVLTALDHRRSVRQGVAP